MEVWFRSCSFQEWAICTSRFHIDLPGFNYHRHLTFCRSRGMPSCCIKSIWAETLAFNHPNDPRVKIQVNGTWLQNYLVSNKLHMKKNIGVNYRDVSDFLLRSFTKW